MDSGVGGVGHGGTRLLSSARSSVAPATDFGARAGRVSRDALIDRTGADDAFITELQRNGLLWSAPPATTTKTPCVWSKRLRHWSVTVSRPGICGRSRCRPIVGGRPGGTDRGTDSQGRGTGARDRAEELVREIAALSVTLHTQLVKAGLRGALD